VSEFAGKRVLVVGLGVSGFAAARALLALDAKVRVTESSDDQNVRMRADTLRSEGAEVETGGHETEMLVADLAVLSPGIPPTSTIVTALEREGVHAISEVELAFRLARCDFLAVTGTNGKTTTVSLLAAMLKEGGIPSVAAGNIGLPLVEAVFSVPDGGAIALEVSSFQLAAIERFAPRVSVVLNIAEDHTDWHGTTTAYAAAKGRIVENQGPNDVFLPNAADPRAMAIAASAKARVVPFSTDALPDGGIGVVDGRVRWRDSDVMSVDDIPLVGAPGVEDAVAAAGAALEYGVESNAVARAIKGFPPLAHRLQVVAESDGVTYIDDSKATNPHATLAAVSGLTDVILIAGGRSKGMDLSELARTVPPVRAVVALGEAAEEVARVFEPLVNVERAVDMRDAVQRARRLADHRGSVLLSPGCASLDMYESYAARGEAFATAVRDSLKENLADGHS
jgi:UDP-N-acetylmuramoylalanine--D-glutamate ligase